LEGELSQEKLERLGRDFDALCQDGDVPHVAVFFVLQNVCNRLACALDGEAVSADRFYELTDGIADQISSILKSIEEDTEISLSELELIISTLIKNLALFHSSK